MNRSPLVAALLTLSLSLTVLPGCGRSKGSATPQAAQELAELRAEQELGFARDADNELQAEIAALLSRFDKTADATLASTPHRMTLLHLAAVYKKPELARCLLLDGADPNARQLAEEPTADMAAESEGASSIPLRPADTPLSWATIPHREGATAAEMLPLINLLVENGADVNQPGPFGAPPLVTSALVPSPAGEEVFLRLLELGARCSEFAPPEAGGKPIPVSALVAANGWSRALEKLLETGATMATPARSALHTAAERPARPGALDCAKLLLARGAETDALNDEGATPLYIAAHSLASAQDISAAEMEATCTLLALLLEHGADPLRCCDADPEFPGSCASDFISMNPEAQKTLVSMGISVPRRSINWNETGSRLLAELCRASLFGTPAEDIAPHFSLLASLLTAPSQDVQLSALYADSIGHVVKLLSRADAARAAELVGQLPLWRDEAAWTTADGRVMSLMEALLTTPELVLPRQTLLEHARRMDAWGIAEAAAVLAELLERDAAAEADIENLCSDASLPIRAGALTARLLRAGLPAPRNGAVAEWMQEHGIAEDTAPAPLRRALLLTSLDKFWYGNMAADEVRALLEAMENIGAAQAAAFYKELAANLSKPEELDRLMEPGGAANVARFELECATALFLWAQREALQEAANTPARANATKD